MTAMLETTRVSRLPDAIGNLRLRLEPARRSGGLIHGGWWPHSTMLAVELQPLLGALSLRLDGIDSVRYHDGDWSAAPSSIEYRSRDVRLDNDPDSPNVVTLAREGIDRFRLLVVPPFTDPSYAYTLVTAAAGAGGDCSPDRLLGTRWRSVRDHRHELLALQRWESDGGAVPVGRALS